MKIRWKIVLLSVIIVVFVIVFILIFLNYFIPQNLDKALKMHGPPPFKEPGIFRRNFLDDVKNSLFLGGAFSIGIAIILSLIFSKFIEKPVVDLKKATKRIANGDFNFSLKKESNDEIGELVEDFNLMIKKLNNLENLRKDLLSKISHELSTPLTGILGYIEAFEDKLIPENKIEDALKTMKKEIERLSNLINDLREYSFIESIKFKLNLEKINLKDEIIHSIEIIKNKYQNKEIDIINNLDDVYILGDKKRIGEIFMNILDNAFKFSDNNKNIYINLEKDEKMATISIKDEGIGIDKEDLPYIFDKFYRAKNNIKISSKGFGLGLSIVKELVEAHKGKIEIYSEKDKGTLVKLFFPLYKN